MASAILGQVACFLFSAALVGFSFFRRDVKTATRMLSVFCSFCLVIIGAIGPQSLANLTVKWGENELSFNRHIPSEEEKAEAMRLIATDASEQELEANPLVQEAMGRKPEERSSVDYLLLSQLEKQRKNPSGALELAYTGVGISQNEKVVEGGLKQVIGQSYEAVGEKTLGKVYLQEAVKVAPILRVDPGTLEGKKSKLDTARLKEMSLASPKE